MKYRCEVVVNVPRGKFIELFDNPANMPKWSPGLQTFEPISGTPGQPCAKSRPVYLMGKRTIEMIETVTTRNLPDEFSGTYDADGVHNIVSNHFHDQGNATHWVLDRIHLQRFHESDGDNDARHVQERIHKTHDEF